jgi:hypothetical protein
MRRSSDLPRRRPRRRLTARAGLITLGIALFVVLVFGRAIARFYVDYLWFKGLTRGDVFWGVIEAKFTLFALFALAFAILGGVNLFVADRLAPQVYPANLHPYVERFHEVFGHRLRPARYIAVAILAMLLALPAAAHWQEWLLFRHRQAFGIADRQFGADVGFYVFELPFLSFVFDWLFAATIIVLLLTAATHVLNGGVVFASAVPKVRNATKGHLAVLLALLAVLKAADYWLLRYDLTNERRGVVQGATYTVVKAQLPAVMLLMLIALLTAALYVSTLRTGRWRPAVVASGLWLVVWVVGGFVYPALVQSLLVTPNQAEREAPYIERNVEATREALGIADVQRQDISFEPVDAADIERSVDAFRNVRLLEPDNLVARFRVDKAQDAGLTIRDLDPDRYDLGNGVEQVLVATRELDLERVANRSWQGRHLINTRGCDLVVAPASRVTSTLEPNYVTIELDRPELYFSPGIDGYAIARTDQPERPCGNNAPYTGRRGVEMSSFARRAAFALAFLDYNVIGSSAINDDSQMLWVRDVRDRVEKVAPFLRYDADPYPVAVEGKVVWVIDAYTTTSDYPYAQAIGDTPLTDGSSLPESANYVRNSVKAVVDAYDGSIVLYVVDPTDPIIRAWREAFPGLFTPSDSMPSELAAHLRYPEDLFRLQSDAYSKYQLDGAAFYTRDGAWSVAKAPVDGTSAAGETATTVSGTTTNANVGGAEFAKDAKTPRFEPYFTLFPTADGDDEFVIIRPFTPFSSTDQFTQLQAYMTASSDPDDYGRLTSYVVTSRPLPDSPAQAAALAEKDAEISKDISLLDTGGTQVRFGDEQLVIVGGRGLVYVRPLYVEGEADKVSSLERVIVFYDGEAVLANSLTDGLAQLFPGFDGDVGEVIGVPVVDSGETPTDDGSPIDETDVAALLRRADELFADADAALQRGDLGEYQDKTDEARRLVAQALDLLAADEAPDTTDGSSTSDAPPSSDAPSTSDAPADGS